VIWDDITAQGQEKRMPFIDGFERRGLEKGLLLGIAAALRIKFGAECLKLMPEIREIRDHEVLDTILSRIRTTASPNDLLRVWTRKRRSKTTERR
jgi:hypothetical protein